MIEKKILQKKWNRTDDSKETVESVEFPEDEIFQNLETLKPSENNSNWKCWRKRKLQEPERRC